MTSNHFESFIPLPEQEPTTYEDAISIMVHDLGVEEPKGDPGRILLSAIITGSINWYSYFNDREWEFFGNNTPEFNDLKQQDPSLRTIMPYETQVPTMEVMEQMKLDPKSPDTLETVIARLTNTGIKIYKLVDRNKKEVGRDKSNTIKRGGNPDDVNEIITQVLLPGADRETILKFIEYEDK